MSDIMCLKLISGEEVIGRVVDVGTTDNGIVLKEVASVMMMPSQSGNGSVSLGLLPFLPYAEENSFKFAQSSVVIKFIPNMDMINNYNRLYGAGIQIAKSF